MIVAVLGVPRSGTSMVAGLVHHLGVPMGSDLLPADRWNQQGYYEDRQFLSIHRVMSFPHGDDERIAMNMPADTLRADPHTLARYRRIVRARCDQHPDWGVKDPRLCFLFGDLVEAKPATAPLKVIVTRRPAADSIASVMDMFQFPNSAATALVGAYGRKLAAHFVEFPAVAKLEVDFDAALGDPVATVAKVAEYLGRPVTKAARQWINPGLRRHGGDYA
jgi:hypothetical protein